VIREDLVTYWSSENTELAVNMSNRCHHIRPPKSRGQRLKRLTQEVLRIKRVEGGGEL